MQTKGSDPHIRDMRIGTIVLMHPYEVSNDMCYPYIPPRLRMVGQASFDLFDRAREHSAPYPTPTIYKAPTIEVL